MYKFLCFISYLTLAILIGIAGIIHCGTNTTNKADRTQSKIIIEPDSSEADVIPGYRSKENVSASSKKASEEEYTNIALNKIYEFNHEPNYKHCKDKYDNIQLTDGIYTTEKFWSNKTTVGWKARNPIVITIDLEETKSIRGFSVNTAGGKAHVYFPFSIYVFISNKKDEFHDVFELTSLSSIHGIPDLHNLNIHKYRIDNIKTGGRYVTFVINCSYYFMVDEIEIFEGENHPVKNSIPVDYIDYVKKRKTKDGIVRRLVYDLRTLKYKIENSSLDDAQKTDLLSDLELLNEEIQVIPDEYDASFKTIFPINHIHNDIFKIYAKFLKQLNYNDFIIWSTNIWNYMNTFENPPEESEEIDLDFQMMRNEYRSLGFNIINLTQTEKDFKIRINNMPGGPNPDYIRVREVQWTDTYEGIQTATALTDAYYDGDAYTIKVPSGLKRQVCLTLNPGIISSECTGTISVVNNNYTYEIPLNLKIFPITFPNNTTLNFSGWDYTDTVNIYSITEQNRDQIRQFLQEHYVKSPWARRKVLNFGTFDKSGQYLNYPNTEYFTSWANEWKGADRFNFYLQVGPDDTSFKSFDFDSQEFEEAIRNWSKFWSDFLKANNYDRERILLLIIDEPKNKEHDEKLYRWAKIIKETEPRFKILNNHASCDKNTIFNSVELADILMASRTKFTGTHKCSKDYKDIYLGNIKDGKKLEFYSSYGPAKLLDPYSYYRIQPWLCWKYGAKGSHFWSFVDIGYTPSSWNEYLSRFMSRSPIFIDENSVTSSKHMEACREGIQDYEYLRMLDSIINLCKIENGSLEIIKEAENFLINNTDFVISESMKELNGHLWYTEYDRSIADTKRIEILNLMMALKLDTDNDGMPNYYEVAYNLNPYCNDYCEDICAYDPDYDCDLDGDGYLNAEEYYYDSNLNDANSTPLQSKTASWLASATSVLQ